MERDAHGALSADICVISFMQLLWEEAVTRTDRSCLQCRVSDLLHSADLANGRSHTGIRRTYWRHWEGEETCLLTTVAEQHAFAAALPHEFRASGWRGHP